MDATGPAGSRNCVFQNTTSWNFLFLNVWRKKKEKRSAPFFFSLCLRRGHQFTIQLKFFLLIQGGTVPIPKPLDSWTGCCPFTPPEAWLAFQVFLFSGVAPMSLLSRLLLSLIGLYLSLPSWCICFHPCNHQRLCIMHHIKILKNLFNTVHERIQVNTCYLLTSCALQKHSNASDVFKRLFSILHMSQTISPHCYT